MADIDVQAIIKRAYIDDTFRIGLMRDFQGTIDSYHLKLTKDEQEKLEQVDWEHFGQLIGGGAQAASWVHIYK